MKKCFSYLIYGYSSFFSKEDVPDENKIKKLAQKSGLEVEKIEMENKTKIIVGRKIESCKSKEQTILEPGDILKGVTSIKNSNQLEKLSKQLEFDKEQPRLRMVMNKKHD